MISQAKQSESPLFRKVLISFLVIVSFLWFSECFAKDNAGVLVAAKASPISALTRKDIRRIFLGLPPLHNTAINKPILNLSDPSTYRLFLKNIMFLTESGYKRKLVKRIFRQGADSIHSIDTVDKLTKHLIEHPDSISFMLENEARKHSGLVIIQELW